MAGQPVFSIVDVETTGFAATRADRIVEIAILRLDTDGKLLDEYTTLVNPRRDVGTSHIHGLTGTDLMHAPEFQEIAGDVALRLKSAIFVAHNAVFDLGFVRAEMLRAGIHLPDLPSLCTIQLSRLLDPDARSRKLCDLCEHFGISTGDSHCALDDARAAGSLLRLCLTTELSGSVKGIMRDTAHASSWPEVRPTGRVLRRSDARASALKEQSLISRLVSRLPTLHDTTLPLTQYLEVLDRILEDRRITEDEISALTEIATDLGIVQEQARIAHESYLKDLYRVAMADGVIGSTEQSDIECVRALLGISADRSRELCCAVSVNPTPSADHRSGVPEQAPLAGQSVCFTGELRSLIEGKPISRSEAEAIAQQHGLIPKSGVSRSLDVLVTADPGSLSGKAQKARDYGVRIMAEAVFWKTLGINVD